MLAHGFLVFGSVGRGWGGDEREGSITPDPGCGSVSNVIKIDSIILCIIKKKTFIYNREDLKNLVMTAEFIASQRVHAYTYS